jgi:hypothetical protein
VFQQYLMFLFLADVLTCYWWVEKSCFMPRPDRRCTQIRYSSRRAPSIRPRQKTLVFCPPITFRHVISTKKTQKFQLLLKHRIPPLLQPTFRHSQAGRRRTTQARPRRHRPGQTTPPTPVMDPLPPTGSENQLGHPQVADPFVADPFEFRRRGVADPAVAAELEVGTPGRNTSQATPRLPIRSSSVAMELPIQPWSCRRARGRNTGSEHQPGHPQVADPFEFRSLPIRSSSVRCRSVRVPTPWSCRSGRGVAAELEVQLGRVGQWLGGGFLEGRRMIRCFCLHLHFCVFFLFHADLSACYWWAKRWWILPPPNRSYFLVQGRGCNFLYFLFKYLDALN